MLKKILTNFFNSSEKVQLINRNEISQLFDTKEDVAYKIHLSICDYLRINKKVISDLPEPYQVIFSTTVAEGDIFNGGLYQYYGNNTAQEYNSYAIEGFSKIGAKKTAELLTTVFEEILKQSKTFRDKYKKIGIQKAFNEANDIHDEIDIEKYDDIFYEIDKEENKHALRLKYIKENLESFRSVSEK